MSDNSCHIENSPYENYLIEELEEAKTKFNDLLTHSMFCRNCYKKPSVDCCVSCLKSVCYKCIATKNEQGYCTCFLCWGENRVEEYKQKHGFYDKEVAK